MTWNCRALVYSSLFSQSQARSKQQGVKYEGENQKAMGEVEYLNSEFWTLVAGKPGWEHGQAWGLLVLAAQLGYFAFSIYYYLHTTHNTQQLQLQLLNGALTRAYRPKSPESANCRFLLECY